MIFSETAAHFSGSCRNVRAYSQGRHHAQPVQVATRANAWQRRRWHRRSSQSCARTAGAVHSAAAGHRSRADAEPEVVVRRQSHAVGKGRLDTRRSRELPIAKELAGVNMRLLSLRPTRSAAKLRSLRECQRSDSWCLSRSSAILHLPWAGPTVSAIVA
jgi:hypothetical protein